MRISPQVNLRLLNKLLGMFGCCFVIIHDLSNRKDTKFFLEFKGWK